MRNHRVVALIPARAGSKGIPGKNLRRLGDRTLLDWAMDVAKGCSAIDEYVVSTDGKRIADCARRHGARVHERSAELSGDDSRVLDTVNAVLSWLAHEAAPPDILVLLQPTSPFRSIKDVEHCLEALQEGADSSATFVEAALHPHRAFRLDEGQAEPFMDGAVPWLPRQALHPAAYELTGAVYAFWVDRLPASAEGVLFGRTHAVLVEPERALDIDTPLDLEIARTLFQRGLGVRD